MDGVGRAAACGGAGLLVAGGPIGPRWAKGVSIDRFTVWGDGAQAAWLEAGVRVVSDRAWRGERPWVPPIPIPGRPDPLPLAPVDPGSVSPRAASR